jgi:NAD(P)-dependent dehydrogenase (short-subunit alcohol dehydrogenase family)
VLDPSRIYILVGGLGGIGGSITKWMFSRGARRFVFVGMSDPAHSKHEALVASVQSMGATVNVKQGDVTSFEDMKRITSAIDEPIGGVVHAAMGLSV